ncbi:unnamed protein product [Rotaria magnacalcarata]|nr:unnamed protein product [Rotaria magnacalcarata]CAF3818007.1 unnamed protein product [Rotaria magnacalcarata]CAF3863137.1 unnamed protein product [Rotaria magnacalcarata]
MFHERNVIRKRTRSSHKQYQTGATLNSSLTADDSSLPKSEPRSSSFTNPLHQAIDLLFVIVNAKQSSITVNERGSNDIVNSDSFNQSWPVTTQKILIRVTRLNKRKSIVNSRHRREIVDSIQNSDIVMFITKTMEDIDSSEEIFGMAKKVAITVFVGVLLCIICCIVTTICICVKCCCRSNKSRKRNEGFVTVPQAVVIQSNSPNSQQVRPVQSWNSEHHPMLPQPSAPPHHMDDYLSERPPPYEKIFSGR